MIQALENTRKRFGIHRVVIVAYRGLKQPSKSVEDKRSGIRVYRAGRIKSLEKQTQEAFLAPEG